MENVEFTVKGDKLIITLDLTHRGSVSSTGKTIRVASTGGFQKVTGTEVSLNLNATVKP